jgi:putative spermidine/putrescine transport system ATP-binding protein
MLRGGTPLASTGAMVMEAFLVLDRVSARYGATTAVDAVSVSVRQGEVLALLGPSGCGKTTTLRMVAGFVAPTTGAIRLNGVDITTTPPHRRSMGVVFQSYALFAHLSVRDNIAYGLRMRRLGRAECRARADAAIDLVGLATLGDRYPHQLSGGQQQRVALARALVIEPAVLLLDEPLSNLDVHLRAEMRAEIRRLQQRLHITTVFVTHDQEEALALADRVAVMDRGRLVEIGTPQALCDQPQNPFTAGFLGARTVIAGTVAAGRFVAPGVSFSDAPPGATAIVLRAARLTLDPASSGPLDLGGVVAACSYLGDRFELDVETPAGRVRVLQPSTIPAPALGSTTRIAALPGGVSFLS